MNKSQKVGTAVVLCLGIALGCLVHSFRSGSHVADSPGDDRKNMRPDVRLSLKKMDSLIQTSDSANAPYNREIQKDDMMTWCKGVGYTNCDEIIKNDPLKNSWDDVDPETGQPFPVCETQCQDIEGDGALCSCLQSANTNDLVPISGTFQGDDESLTRCVAECKKDYTHNLDVEFFDWKKEFGGIGGSIFFERTLPHKTSKSHSYVFSTVEGNECKCLKPWGRELDAREQFKQGFTFMNTYYYHARVIGADRENADLRMKGPQST